MKIKVIFIEIGKSEGGTLRGKKIKAKPDELIFKQTRFEMATNYIQFEIWLCGTTKKPR